MPLRLLELARTESPHEGHDLEEERGESSVIPEPRAEMSRQEGMSVIQHKGPGLSIPRTLQARFPVLVVWSHLKN